MTLAVGTMVLVVGPTLALGRATLVGMTGEITGALAPRLSDWGAHAGRVIETYVVNVPGAVVYDAQPDGWLMFPCNLIPLTPPPGTELDSEPKPIPEPIDAEDWAAYRECFDVQKAIDGFGPLDWEDFERGAR